MAIARSLGWYVRASRMLMAGLVTVLEFGVGLIRQRSPEVGRHPLVSGMLVLVLLWIVLEPLADKDPAPSPVRPSGQWHKDAAKFLPFACFAFVYGFAADSWTAFALGEGMGWLFWALGRIRHRSYFVAVVGNAFGGIVVFLLPWSNQQRQEFVFVLGGFSVALQGIHELILELKNPQCSGT
jgi:hypothetical protein